MSNGGQFESLDGLEVQEVKTIRLYIKKLENMTGERAESAALGAATDDEDERIKLITTKLLDTVLLWAQRPRPERPIPRNTFVPDSDTRVMVRELHIATKDALSDQGSHSSEDTDRLFLERASRLAKHLRASPESIEDVDHEDIWDPIEDHDNLEHLRLEKPAPKPEVKVKEEDEGLLRGMRNLDWEVAPRDEDGHLLGYAQFGDDYGDGSMLAVDDSTQRIDYGDNATGPEYDSDNYSEYDELSPLQEEEPGADGEFAAAKSATDGQKPTEGGVEEEGTADQEHAT